MNHKSEKNLYSSDTYHDSTYGGSTTYSSQYATPKSNYSCEDQSGSNQFNVLYFTNLNYTSSEHDLMNYLKSQKFNPVRAKLLYDKDGKSRGTGFVQMQSPNDA